MANVTQCSKPYTSRDKMIVSIMAGLLFLLLSSPFTYRLVNTATSYFGLPVVGVTGIPNMAGLILMTILFIIITRLMMA